MSSVLKMDRAELSAAIQQQFAEITGALQRLAAVAAKAKEQAAQATMQRTAAAREAFSAEQQRATAAVVACYERCQGILQESTAMVLGVLPAIGRLVDKVIPAEEQVVIAEWIRRLSHYIGVISAAARHMLEEKCAEVSAAVTGARARAAFQAEAARDAAARARGRAMEQLRALEKLARDLLLQAEAITAPRVRAVHGTAVEYAQPLVARAAVLKTALTQRVQSWSPEAASQLEMAYAAATSCELSQAARLPALLYSAVWFAAKREAPRRGSCGATEATMATAQAEDDDADLHDANSPETRLPPTPPVSISKEDHCGAKKGVDAPPVPTFAREP
eukprot:TRINITY_DN8865_c0_g1_i2.p1 TRINITY_DN8865_c0_g1~~TRINITY_DN8865_c0_g1_i2.p1  ORF type:complete len:334 (+),score=126.35 TRINITY_DN8865_c0_g1_i2:96-1097(+)